MPRRRHRRPVSVTIVAWLILASGAFAMLGTAYAFDTPAYNLVLSRMPMPPRLALATNLLGSTLTIFSGLFLLQGANWARYLFLGWSLISHFLSFYTLGANRLLWIGAVAANGLMIVFLFLPKASAYFGHPRTPDQHSL